MPEDDLSKARIDLSRLSEIASDPARCTRRLHFGPVDFSCPFIDEALTPLYYAPVYRELSRAQRLRYNQLAGLKVNEQFVMLEDILVDVLIPALTRHRRVRARPGLVRCLREMVAEERLHIAMFEDLNRLCLPPAYARSRLYFMRERASQRLVFHLSGHAPGMVSFGLWFLILIEEYTVGFSRRMMRAGERALGPLEANFVRLHREHVKDELRHLHIDHHLLDVLAPRSRLARRINARLMAKCIESMFVPRDAPAIIAHLVGEHPELAPEQGRLETAALAVAANEDYQRSLFSREHTPLTFSLFDRQPELAAAVSEVTPAYRPRRY